MENKGAYEPVSSRIDVKPLSLGQLEREWMLRKHVPVVDLRVSNTLFGTSG